jgi:hypothetical protein
MKLYNNTVIPDTISIRERIFRIETFDQETVLCNLAAAQMLIKTNNCKRIKHYCNNKFETISKLEVKEMPL